MSPIDPIKLSLDYLLENEVITILSRDYVIEHGTNYDDSEIVEITISHIDYMIYPGKYYPDNVVDNRGVFSGVLYAGAYCDQSLLYYTHYKDGLKNEVEVEFYYSGKVKNYCIWKNNRLVGIYYEWKD